jgi:SPP1 family predicted phage head-tail adaptor
MDAGELDRKITLQRQGADFDNGLGTEPGEWATLASVWAKLMPMSGAERLAALENAAFASVRFLIRKSSDVEDLNAKDRLLFNTVAHNIVNVREDGRAFLVIDAVARGDGAD